MRRIKSLLLCIIMIASSTVFAFGATAATPKIEAISLGAENKTVRVGEVFQLTATLRPADASQSDVYWSSSDTRVATVSNGKVTTYRAGGSIIQASNATGSVYARVFVSVGVPYSEWKFRDELSGVRRDYYDYYGYYPYYINPSSSYYFYDPYYYKDTDYSNYYYSNPYSYDYRYNYDYYPYSYAIVKPSYLSTVQPGTATSADGLGAELRASATTWLNGEAVEFKLLNANSKFKITPQKISGDGANELKFGKNILNRLTKFGLKSIDYNLGFASVALYPEMENQQGITLTVARVIPQGNMLAAWSNYDKPGYGKLLSVACNKNADAIELTIKIDNTYSKSQIDLVKYNEKTSDFDIINSDDYNLFFREVEGEKAYYLITDKISPGIYGIVKK